jgi:protocatechuate 3,4-dioxygenase, beta subunit
MHESTTTGDEMMMTMGLSRRRLLGSATLAVIGATAPLGSVRAALTATPRQTEGPFYPPNLPLDSDNDLVRVTGHADPALGIITHVSGRVLDPNGRPVAGAKLEIWQCDANGRYLAQGDRGGRDAGFQGYGTTLTDASGAYRFRTIKPVPYPGRTPHIHFAISGGGFERLVTQMYVAGEPRNADDFVFNDIDAAARDRVLVDLQPAPELEPDALKGLFDIVLA